ncbi:YidB family protein [Elioraea rosea]|uniref:YidB family protein n=1 Tax=Elioraea rosea TaxID=2492390 RepID=UPI0011827A07|nr:YidB family protein [Elioraea rosea]
MPLGNILGSVLQGMLGGQAQAGHGGAQANPLAGVIAALLTPQQGQAAQAFGSGGIEEILSQFRNAGYGSQAESWLGTGPNKSIEPQAMRAVFGEERLGAMAAEAGLPKDDLMSGLARMLPQVIDGLSPQGQLPQQRGGDMNQMLAQVLGGLLGGRR